MTHGVRSSSPARGRHLACSVPSRTRGALATRIVRPGPHRAHALVRALTPPCTSRCRRGTQNHGKHSFGQRISVHLEPPGRLRTQVASTLEAANQLPLPSPSPSRSGRESRAQITSALKHCPQVARAARALVHTSRRVGLANQRPRRPPRVITTCGRFLDTRRAAHGPGAGPVRIRAARSSQPRATRVPCNHARKHSEHAGCASRAPAQCVVVGGMGTRWTRLV
ncbi:hypothetical protein B0H15DRAFT_485390 [Mycena belliarum]|uniref:Uncharacterized protein n=1 Tax=Mycena belliarum TaxID=1033014 RepID=A0AAD6TW42_9AGAR|nr:hypothetical protein B0H15DRAFT_485390 [Mycena belliae]